MDTNIYEQFCVSLPDVIESYPFDETTKVMKVSGKMFAIFGKEETISLKCEPNKALEYRTIYQSVTAGYHLNKTHWNTIELNGDVDQADLKLMIIHSYQCVIEKLPKQQRENLKQQLLFWQLKESK